MDENEEKIPIVKEKFTITGIITSPSFQKCRFLALKLFRSFPDLYEAPIIKPMLNVEWEEYLTKMKRSFGDGIWALQKPLTIFSNEKYIGDDKDFVNHLTDKYHFSLNVDLYELGKNHLIDLLRGILGKYRQLAYLTISIKNEVVGSLLFELYNDLVPLACENFLQRCKDVEGGYTGTPVHRIVKNSWIQCGGWDLTPKPMPCENYVVLHDRRGILGATNTGRHKDNSTQFFVTLAPTPWMNNKYVAFGQLLQGEEVLKQIENVPTYYESPKWPIDIVMSGEVTLDGIPDYFTSTERPEFQDILPSALPYAKLDVDLVQTSSRFSMTKFQKKMYTVESDESLSYLAYSNLPDYLIPKAASEGSSATEIAPTAQGQVSVEIDFAMTQELLTDCKMPTISQTTII